MMEKKTVWKWFFVWDFDKEEDWLNEMADEGWVLCSVGFCSYTFERCAPEEYTIRLEMKKPDDGYISFMEETGAEYIGRVVQWIYFRKRNEYGPFDLFSDMDSRIEHLDRIGLSLRIIGIANLLIGVANSINRQSIGWINLLCATLLMYGLGRIRGKQEALERERTLRE
ncbi:MAG: DUF2812 domain-containing protein [Erysipelotrichaceae bacterium]|nr:DUF2812 domain-containing protein [Erysipelotrichaceae bacterium]